MRQVERVEHVVGDVLRLPPLTAPRKQIRSEQARPISADSELSAPATVGVPRPDSIRNAC